MCWAAEREFGNDARTPGEARRFVTAELTGALAAAGRVQLSDDAELLISELFTNAIQAGTRNVHLQLMLHRDELELRVRDNGAGWPRLARPGEQDTSGRGLVLVDALAERWGVEQVPGDGKVVWAALDVPPELTRSLSCSREGRREAVRPPR